MKIEVCVVGARTVWEFEIEIEDEKYKSMSKQDIQDHCEIFWENTGGELEKKNYIEVKWREINET